ncbi:notch ligand family member [Anaeramoeba flamelloides]|uniref:Notch ligand family member n=1 Tax=Anaeramoeba flamelloides TaxID=1746091 RepID=A0AAV7Z6Q3_9EUKA|nr:notch ligand family member [Anaeramoeba flamelloides]
MKGSLLIGLFLFLLLLNCCFCDYTESFITPSKVPQTFSPDSLDELNNWAKLVYTENYEPTLKPNPPNSFDWYMNNNASAYAVISADKPDTFGYRVGNFGFNLPVVSDSSLTIQEINLYSTRDAIQKTGSDALDMQYLFDVSLDFIFVYNSTVTTIEVIENDQVNGTKKMRSWEDPNDSSIVETLRIYGGGMEEFENTLNTRMINDNNFFVRSFTEIRNPLDSDPVDWPNYSFNAVLGNLNTTIKYEWTIQAWGISHEIGGADDLIQVFLHEGSVAENGGYDGIDCFWMCKIGENIFKSTQVNVNDSWIGCQAPSLQIGKSYSVDVSYINNANQNQFTNSGLNFFYSVCDCDDECINGECHNNICECDKGWNGTYCSEDICQGNNCSGNGDCNKNNGKCDCDDGYSGEDCSINLCEVEYDNCSNHGECSYHKEKGSCICDTQNGWEGDKCSEQICDTKDCGQFSTPNQGECLINGTCLCNYGYSGEKCQTDDCESMDCIHGVCDLEQNKCECESGYEGEYCNEKTSADSWSEKMSVKFGMAETSFLVLFSFFIIIISLAGLFFGVVIKIKINKKKRRQEQYKSILGLPIFDFQTLFGDYYFISNSTTSQITNKKLKQTYLDLSDLLVTNLDFVESLLHSEENQVFDYLIRSILYIFESQGEGANLLKHFIVKEINECNDPNFLFKGYSIATRLWTSFAHLPVGINYLHQTLSQPIYDLITEMSISEIEINPNKLNETDSISSNKYNLMAAVETILSSIEKNSDQIPEQFCFILDTLSKTLKLKWPEQILPQIGSFIISMLFNPVITSLNDYGLIEEPPEDSIIRIFILIAKVLTQLSNCSVFDEKDDYLTEMNEYLTNNHERMSKFLSQISTPLIEFEENALFPPSPLPKNIFEVSCANVHRFLLLNENKILNNLEQICENQDRYQLLKKEMQELIFLIGEPIPLQTLEDV